MLNHRFLRANRWNNGYSRVHTITSFRELSVEKLCCFEPK